jgi:hypothetical protein
LHADIGQSAAGAGEKHSAINTAATTSRDVTGTLPSNRQRLLTEANYGLVPLPCVCFKSAYAAFFTRGSDRSTNAEN